MAESRGLRVGLDFDNTLVGYDALFHLAAVEQGLVPQTVLPTKLAVRTHLRQAGNEDRWTELQGHIYGARMSEATLYPGASEFLDWARAQGFTLCIVSHRTKYPFLGVRHDLHAAARRWVETHLAGGPQPLVPMERVFFEETRAAKIQRIAALDFDVYVDDLPEILQDAQFPAATARVLFDPDGHHGKTPEITVAASWRDIRNQVEARWRSRA